MTSIDPKHGKAPLGDLIRFPHPRTTIDNQPTNGGATAPDLTNTETTGPAPEQPTDTTVDSEPGAELAPDTERAPARRRGSIPPALRGTATRTWTWATTTAGPYVTAKGRIGLRHGAYVRDGTGKALRSGWRRLMLTDLAEAVRDAQMSGDLNTAAELEQRRREAANDRWKRVEAMVTLSGKVLATGAGAWLTVTTVVALCGFVVWALPGGAGWDAVWTEGYWAFWQGLASWIGWIASLWPWIGLAGLLCTVYALWRFGLPEGERLVRAEPLDESEGKDPVPGRDVILRALRNLGIKDLTTAIDKGPTPRFPVPPHRDGQGYSCQLELPEGQVTADMIRKKKDVLAANLTRFPREVWPGEPDDKPGVLSLWVADQGALSRDIGPWPLVEDGSTDYFTAIPVGVNARGDQVNLPLFESNVGTAGKMGSGKSSLLISAVCGAMLDPLVEIDVYVMADNADFDPMRPRLRTLRTGTGDDVARDCLSTLQELFDELEVRGQALREHGVRKNNRQVAAKDSRLRPRVLVIDECQALFAYGENKDTARSLAKQLISAGRKYGITCLFATPEPSTDSLPRQMMSIISHLACFAIGDQRSNDAILGTGAYKSGVDATSLRPKTDSGKGDVGTAVCKGFTDQPGPLRMYYINEDQAAHITHRALELREDTGITTEPSSTVEPKQRDLLDDLAQVLGHEGIKPVDAVALLRDLDRTWKPYQDMHGSDLVTALEDLGIRVPAPSNRPRIDPTTVRDALASREATDTEPDDEGE